MPVLHAAIRAVIHCLCVIKFYLNACACLTRVARVARSSTKRCEDFEVVRSVLCRDVGVRDLAITILYTI